MDAYRFAVAHVGINCADQDSTAAAVARFTELFGLPVKDGNSSTFTGALLELMKGNGRGTHGHIAIETDDLPGACQWLETQGVSFDADSAKYDADGHMIFIYLQEEIAGFAVHLLQRKGARQ